MSSWRDRILDQVCSDRSPLTVVADPDALLLDERIQQSLAERGCDLLTFDDPVAFRFDYESHYRSRWDHGEAVRPLVVRTGDANLDGLPYDVLSAGRPRTIGLASLFPTLSPSVIAALDRGDLDLLGTGGSSPGAAPLGDTATKEFVLSHVFGADATRVRNPTDLLELLLRLHSSGRHLPAIVAEHMVGQLRRKGSFADWPLESLLANRDDFYAFLQERWPIFLHRLAGGKPETLGEEALPYLAHHGPVLLPFGDPAVRPLVTDLFLNAQLQPAPLAVTPASLPNWAEPGVIRDPRHEWLQRLDVLLGTAEAHVPADSAVYRDWTRFARSWAELGSHLSSRPDQLDSERRGRLDQLRERVNSAFLAWLSRRYGTLYNQPAIPVMVHHIPRALAQHRAEHQNPRVALIVLDGCAFDQWVTVRSLLASQHPSFRYEERGVFAWIPTVTSVSRQAIFSGKRPDQFASSIFVTNREPSRWTSFWAEAGVPASAVGYAILPSEPKTALAAVDELTQLPQRQVVGVVIRAIDEMAHGTPQGMLGLHAEVRAWAQSDFLPSVLNLLWDRRFDVFLTSDHGNLAGKGIGSPQEGAIADTRGQRVRVYSTDVLRARVAAALPTAVVWPSIGLPPDCLPLLAPYRAAFVRPDEVVVAHGGASVEEVIVPFVRIQRGTV